MAKNKKKVKEVDIEINPSFNKEIEQLMLTRGLDRLVLANKRSTFFLDEAIVPYKPKVESAKVVTQGAAKQMEVCRRLLDHPLRSAGVFVLNSFPTDLRAKMLASCVMSCAIENWRDMDIRKRKGKSLPMWIRVLGHGEFDQIKNIKEANPSMLIISNVNDESSANKVERLRDILDVFDNIPRIVVTAGSDPITFMMKRVYYPIVGAVRLGSNATINVMDL